MGLDDRLLHHDLEHRDVEYDDVEHDDVLVHVLTDDQVPAAGLDHVLRQDIGGL